MHYYMFDTILELSNDKSGGFCEKGEDVGWAVFGVRIIFDVVGTLMTMPITLVLTNRAIRKYLLNMQLEWVYTACLRYQPKGATGGLSKMVLFPPLLLNQNYANLNSISDTKTLMAHRNVSMRFVKAHQSILWSDFIRHK